MLTWWGIMLDVVDSAYRFASVFRKYPDLGESRRDFAVSNYIYFL